MPRSLAPGPFNRRRFLTASAWLAAVAALRPHALLAQTKVGELPRFPVGVCDWMLLKRQKLGAFEIAHAIGADGLEVDMGGLGQRETFDNQLAKPEVREQFLARSRELGVRVCSLAMSGFYAQSFAERPGVERMVQDCIDTMVAMQVKVAFLPLGVRSDLVQFPHLRPVVVQRLRAIASRAADAGVVIGIETALDAAGEAALLDDVGSPAIRSYFNFANPLQSGRDLHAELRTLGRERICQIHASNQDRVWLENDPQIDVPAVKRTLEELGWQGWLVIERSRDANDARNVRRNYGANTQYLKTVFQSPSA
ncbi:MAG TPA: sugar phosphate isomerase/epimerase family protein [Candidatus Synoicihabitans sp.]|nr:sugar phosphate isomerase/epimerase family protein [Candidatus Synoicihabitans sp.]